MHTTGDGTRRRIMKLANILVPLDGSTLAERALAKALELVNGSSATTVVLLRAAEATTLPGADPTEAQIAAVQEAETYLEAVAQRLAAQGVQNVQTSVWYGPPAPAIIEAARVRAIDLIVMSTHGRSGLGRLILGSVAESVLRGTHTPILLLRAEEAPIEPPAGAARRHDKEIVHV
jgi:nucleotide-binding universal stress UspA family protein